MPLTGTVSLLTLSILLRKSPSKCFILVPSDKNGEKLLDGSIFSEDATIFDQTIENMHWSLPALFVEADPPNNFSCVFVHEDTDYRAEMAVSATLTERELKEKICTSSSIMFSFTLQMMAHLSLLLCQISGGSTC